MSTTTPEAAPAAETPPAKPRRPWFSGWCSPVDGRCQDGLRKNKSGEPIRHCLYMAENGEKVIPRYVYCACACHADPNQAGQATWD